MIDFGDIWSHQCVVGVTLLDNIGVLCPRVCIFVCKRALARCLHLEKLVTRFSLASCWEAGGGGGNQIKVKQNTTRGKTFKHHNIFDKLCVSELNHRADFNS